MELPGNKVFEESKVVRSLVFPVEHLGPQVRSYTFDIVVSSVPLLSALWQWQSARVLSPMEFMGLRSVAGNVYVHAPCGSASLLACLPYASKIVNGSIFVCLPSRSM
eukprot:TRINITY_DN2771_c0_g1_i4.p1 TRINITY_DN2771_c0_g1~~TRINITY_DN2771_c0_g1_i4.p1  ORF type:complete len:107 (+),score=1.96 TRINITY_DN2771_c0_g1_i4:193-513(+)